jgi:hypothetical protein
VAEGSRRETSAGKGGAYRTWLLLLSLLRDLVEFESLLLCCWVTVWLTRYRQKFLMLGLVEDPLFKSL